MEHGRSNFGACGEHHRARHDSHRRHSPDAPERANAHQAILGTCRFGAIALADARRSCTFLVPPQQGSNRPAQGNALGW